MKNETLKIVFVQFGKIAAIRAAAERQSSL